MIHSGILGYQEFLSDPQTYIDPELLKNKMFKPAVINRVKAAFSYNDKAEAGDRKKLNELHIHEGKKLIEEEEEKKQDEKPVLTPSIEMTKREKNTVQKSPFLPMLSVLPKREKQKVIKKIINNGLARGNEKHLAFSFPLYNLGHAGLFKIFKNKGSLIKKIVSSDFLRYAGLTALIHKIFKQKEVTITAAAFAGAELMHKAIMKKLEAMQ